MRDEIAAKRNFSVKKISLIQKLANSIKKIKSFGAYSAGNENKLYVIDEEQLKIHFDIQLEPEKHTNFKKELENKKKIKEVLQKR